jgi:hypothetical protein
VLPFAVFLVGALHAKADLEVTPSWGQQVDNDGDGFYSSFTLVLSMRNTGSTGASGSITVRKTVSGSGAVVGEWGFSITVLPGGTQVLSIPMTGSPHGYYDYQIQVPPGGFQIQIWPPDPLHNHPEETAAEDVSAPEIEVRGNDVVIANGDDTPSEADGTDFGSVRYLHSTTDFSVANTGASSLGTTNPSTPTGFSLAEGLSSSISSGTSDVFTVSLDGTLHADGSHLGTYQGTVLFGNTDADESPFEFSIIGTLYGAYRSIDGNTVTIRVVPPRGCTAWVIEESIPSGLTPSGITGPNASWNSATRKITWYGTGDSEVGVTYTVSGEPGSYTCQGTANMGGEQFTVSGFTGFDPCLPHPADLNQDWCIVMSEAIGYAAGWVQGVHPLAYAIRALYIWQNGCHYDCVSGPEPMCWVLASP